MILKLLSQYHPVLYFLSVEEKRIRRRLRYVFDFNTYAHKYSASPPPFRMKKHQSKLIKKLGESETQLQLNKVENLKLVIPRINGILIRPGETFSFYKLVGRPTKRKGYLPGMELSHGEARAGIGGGICQSTNLINWLVLHSPLTITERHHHSFDPFPDDGRVLPFASGATVFYNYLDYQVRNDTAWTFQINLWLTDKLLEGEIRVSEELDFAYHVYEKDHKFVRIKDSFYRSNQIWRKKVAKFKSGAVLDRQLMFRNFGKVKYVPESFHEY